MSESLEPSNRSSADFSHAASSWTLKSQVLTFCRVPCVMGIVNVTPDSFSDGGKHDSPNAAVEHALRLAEQGAGILDIGGESTRPYSDPVSTNDELNRVIPVIEKLASQCQIPISIDTSKAAVAKAAVAAGAEIINDVTGLEGDPDMIKVAIESGAGVCAMHMQGTPQSMQDDPSYNNVTDDIFRYLSERKSSLLSAGLELERICLDPGIGFGKTHEHNLQLIAECEQFHRLGCPILVGHSRKGFLGKLLGDKTLNRDTATLAVSLLLAQKKIQVIRVHEVEQTVQAINVLAAF